MNFFGRERCGDGLFSDSSNLEAFRKLCENGRLFEAIWFAMFMQKHGFTISISIFHCLLEGCVKQQSLAASREVNCLVNNSDIKSSSSIIRKLIHTYASCGSLANADQVFEAVSEPDVFMWTAIISAHARFGEGEQAIALYHRMKQTSVKPDGHLLVAVFQACAKAEALLEGELFHADAVEGGFEQIVFVSNSLINMYGKCESLESGCIVFNRLLARDAVSWNSMMTGFLQQCLDGEALQLAAQMQEEGIDPNPVTLVCSLKACTSLNALVQGKLVHARTIFFGLESDLFVGSALIDMYAKGGDLDCAQVTFLRRHEHSLVMWNALIAGYAMHGQCEETGNLLDQMLQDGMKPNNVTWNAIITAQVQHGHAEAALRSIEDMQSNGMEFDNATTVSLLIACSSIADLEKGMKIHQSFLNSGCEPDVIVGCSLINMYAKCGSIESARRVFDEWPFRNVVTWNAIIACYAQHGECQVASQLFYQMLEGGIRPDHITWNTLIMGYAQHGHGQEAIQLFEKMKQSGLDPDLDTYSSVLRACRTAAFIEIGRIIHVDIIDSSVKPDIVVGNSLVDMYVHCGCLEDAYLAFWRLPEKDVVTWSTLINGFTQNNGNHEAICLFKEMQLTDTEPNEYTFACVLKACSNISALHEGRLVHVQVTEQGFERQTAVGNSLINMYSKCGSLDDAHEVFKNLKHQDVVTWTSIIDGFVQHRHHQKALSLFEQMEKRGIKPNQVTFILLLQACSKLVLLDKVKWLHDSISEFGYCENVHVIVALIDAYASCWSVKDAARVFSSSPKQAKKDVLIWNAMITAYVHSGQSEDAILVFQRLRKEKLEPDQVTYAAVLKACADTVALDEGKLIHALLLEQNLESIESIFKELINMYARCGNLEDAYVVFVRLPKLRPAAWSAMIAALAHHNDFKLATRYFQVMQKEGIRPDAATFVSILCACSHVGMVDQGRFFFKSMLADYGITPDTNHYNCFIDILGRAGCLAEAEELLEIIPVGKNVVGLICLLTHCRTFSKVILGRRCFDHLMTLEHKNAAGYVLMSQTYAQSCMWEDAEEIEDLRLSREVWKKRGKAVIEVNNKVHSFLVGETSNPHLHAIHTKLERLNTQLERAGYVPRVRPGGSIFDVYEEDVSTAHCEKLAIAFGLISTPRGTILRVFKNLRVCTDCHDTIKVISRIERREIVLVDSYRMHHFKDGTCSCHDFF